MKDWRKIVGKNVRQCRLQKRLTQEQLAFAAEIDLTYVGGYRAGPEKSQSIGNCENRGRAVCSIAKITRRIGLPEKRQAHG
jgi:transcriptional regulator with XRE-family HTH domain